MQIKDGLERKKVNYRGLPWIRQALRLFALVRPNQQIWIFLISTGYNETLLVQLVNTIKWKVIQDIDTIEPQLNSFEEPLLFGIGRKAIGKLPVLYLKES